MRLPRTPSQTVGPFFEFGLLTRTELVESGLAGAIRIEGRVLDGAGDPVPDGLVEIWGADSDGHYEGNAGWGRCQTGPDGGYAFTTVKPGRSARAGRPVQAPHVTVLSSRAACSSRCSRALLPRRGRGERRRSPARRSRGRGGEGHAPRRRRRARQLPLRHPPAGRRADGLLHDARGRSVTYWRLDGPADAPVVRSVELDRAQRWRCGSRRCPCSANALRCCATTIPGHGTSASEHERRTRSKRSRAGCWGSSTSEGLERVSFCGLSLGGGRRACGSRYMSPRA